MRILLVTGIFPPDVGGPATYVPRIATALSRRGHEVSVVTLSDSPRHDDRVYPFRVRRVRRRLAKPLRLLVVVWGLLRWGRGADVLFVSGLELEAVVANLLLKKPLVQKVVGDWVWERATNRGWVGESFEEFQRNRYGPRIEALKALRRICLRRADVVVVPSRYLAVSVRGDGVPAERVRVVYNAVEPVDGVRTKPTGLEARHTLITGGRLVSWKGVDGIIRALATLGEDVGLVVVGDGPEERDLRELARRLDVEGRVRFTGRLDRARMFSAFAAADVFVLNSTYEGLPHIVLEAMAAGLPVVATDVGGTGEIVEHGRTGLLVPPGDADALRRVLAELLAHVESRRRLADRGREQVRQRFGEEWMVNETERVLQDALRHGGRRWHQDIRDAMGSVLARLRRGFGGHVAALTAANGLGALLSLIQGIVVARALGPQLYGVMTLVTGYAWMWFAFIDVRSADMSVKMLGEFHARGQAARALALCRLGYLVDFSMALVTGLLVLATASWAERHVVQAPGTAPLMLLSAGALLFRGLIGTPHAVLTTLGRFAALAWLEGTTALLRTTLVAGAALAGLGVGGVVWAQALVLAAYGLVFVALGERAAWRAWARSGESRSLRHLRGAWRDIATLLFHSNLHGWLLLVPRQLDVTALGYLAGPVEAGYYRVAKAIPGVVGLIGTPLQTVMLPRLTRLWSLGHGRQSVELVTRLMVVLGMPLAGLTVGLVLSAPFMVRLAVGEAFAPAGPLAQILLAGTALWTFFFWVRPWFTACGKLPLYVRWLAVSLLPYALCVVLVRELGASGMAVAYVAHTLLLLVPLGVWALSRRDRL